MKPLAAALAFGILTAWVPAQWPWRVTQCALFLIAAYLVGRQRIALRWSAWTLALGGSVVWAVAQFVARTSIYPWETYNARLTWTAWLCAFLIAEADTMRKPQTRHWFLEAASIFSFVLAFAAILQRFTANGKIFWLFDATYGSVAMGPWVYPNQYSAFVMLILPLSLWQARGWTLAGPALLAASVFVSGSMAGSILVCLEVAAMQLMGRLSSARGPAIVAVAAAIIIAVTGWDALAAKFARDAPLKVRGDLLASTIDMARDRPLMGSGLGTWYVAYPRFAKFDDGIFDNEAHNDWAQWLAEGGVPFFALMLVMGVASATAAWRNPWAMGLVFVLAHCLIEYHFQERPVFGAIYFTIAGLTRVRHNQE